jgi:hypothetical protein
MGEKQVPCPLGQRMVAFLVPRIKHRLVLAKDIGHRVENVLEAMGEIWQLLYLGPLAKARFAAVLLEDGEVQIPPKQHMGVVSSESLRAFCNRGDIDQWTPAARDSLHPPDPSPPGLHKRRPIKGRVDGEEVRRPCACDGDRQALPLSEGAGERPAVLDGPGGVTWAAFRSGSESLNSPRHRRYCSTLFRKSFSCMAKPAILSIWRLT